MEEVLSVLISICTSVVMSVLTWRLMNWIWFRPKRLEKLLKEQGLKGTDYRILTGDLKETWEMLKDTLSRPITFSDDITSRAFPLMVRTVKTYGKDSFTWTGPTPRLNIMNPEIIKEVFMKTDSFLKPQLPLGKLVVCGVISYEGKKWVKHRKIINPAFHMEKLKNMIPAFHLCCTEMLKKWEILTNNAKQSCEIDVWPYLQNMTGDVISHVAFGTSFEDGRRIFTLQTEQAQLFVQFITRFFYIPGWRFMPTKLNKRMREIECQVEILLTNMIREREKAMEIGEAPKDDLLGALLESNQNEMKKHKDNKSAGMSIAEVIDECKLFYLAGQETTALLLVWTMVLLSKFPNWQAQAREEVFKVFGNNDPHFDGLVHLKVITMILNEVLRLYPPAPIVLRKTKKPTQLGNLSLPGGIETCVPIILVHRDPDLWGDDANEFKPERFAEGVSKATKGRVSFLPFIWGPRICVGQNFSMNEAKIMLALILKRFTFELSPSYAHAPMSILTLQPQHGAHIIIHKI